MLQIQGKNRFGTPNLPVTGGQWPMMNGEQPFTDDLSLLP